MAFLDNVQVWYDFNESAGSNLIDESGNGRSASKQGPGDDFRIDTGSFNPNTEPYMFLDSTQNDEAWYKGSGFLTSPTNITIAGIFSNPSGPRVHYGLVDTANDEVVAAIEISSRVQPVFRDADDNNTEIDFSSNADFFVVIRWNESTETMRIDFREFGDASWTSKSVTSPSFISSLWSPDAIMLGADPTEDDLNLGAGIDSFAIWDREISDAERDEYYNSGDGLTYSQAVNTPPNADLTLTEQQGLDVEADASGSNDPDGTIVQYDYDWGDGTSDTSAGQTATHTYASGGSYSVTLTITDDGGTTASATTSITIENTPPNITFSVSQIASLKIEADATSTFDPDGNDTNLTYDYDWGDSTTSTGAGVTPTHSYGSAGTKTVTVTVTDELGGISTASTNIQVEANSPPNVFLSVSRTGFVVTGDASGTTDPDGDDNLLTYDWDFDGAVVNGGAKIENFEFSSSGVYTVSLTVTDDEGASTTLSRDVTINDLTVTTNPPTIGGTDNATLSGQVTSTPVDTTFVRFEWKKSSDSSFTQTDEQSINGTGTFSEFLGGLSPGVSYEVRTLARSSSSSPKETDQGSTKTFTTAASAAGGEGFRISIPLSSV